MIDALMNERVLSFTPTSTTNKRRKVYYKPDDKIIYSFGNYGQFSENEEREIPSITLRTLYNLNNKCDIWTILMISVTYFQLTCIQHYCFFASTNRLMSFTANAAAPRPLSILTTLIPGEHELSIDSRGAKPWKAAP